MKTAPFLSLNWKDVLRGFVVAFLTVVITGVSTSLNNQTLPNLTDIEHLCLLGLGAGFAYLIKNIFTNSDDQLMKKEPTDIVKP